ncbi:MAG: hypothetical protein ABIN69_00645 [Aestuariivirga sp.]
MVHTNYTEFAEALVFVHGNRAASEAARHALLCEKSGDTETAAHWRKLQRQLATRLESQTDFLKRCA